MFLLCICTSQHRDILSQWHPLEGMLGHALLISMRLISSNKHDVLTSWCARLSEHGTHVASGMVYGISQSEMALLSLVMSLHLGPFPQLNLNALPASFVNATEGPAVDVAFISDLVLSSP